MTIHDVEREVLSLRTWLRRAVLPTSLVLVGALVGLAMASSSREALDHASVLAGFFALYLVLVRGGHVLMVRSLHSELKRLYPEEYARRLAPVRSLRGRNAGFVLARIKRSMIDDGVIPNPNRFD